MPPDDLNPFEDLRASLNDEPGAPGSGGGAAAKAVPPPLPAPPPLPKRSNATLPSMPSVASGPPASTPSAVPGLPPQVVRPAGPDPFQEPPEPRPPRGGPEEKLEFFRQVIKQKEETLGRARSLYTAVDNEAQQLRLVATDWKAKLDAALEELSRLRELPEKVTQLKDMLEKDTVRAEAADAKILELTKALEQSEAERKDLSRALAEVEAQVPELSQELQNERTARAQVAEELIGAKEALTLAQDRVSELVTQKSEVEGNLEAVNEQYSHVTAENQGFAAEVERLTEEVRTLTAERDAAQAEVQLGKQEREEIEGQLTALVSARDQAAQGAQATQGELGKLQKQLDKLKADAEAALRDERTKAAGIQAELDRARAELGALEAERARLEDEAARVRGEAETANTKKLRDELNVANRKAMEAQAALQKERKEREQVEWKIIESDRKERELLVKVEKLEKSMASAPKAAPAADPAVVAERDQLKTDLANMKRKLVAAEAAMEAAASLRAKVARLEAQLQGKAKK